MKQEMQLHFPRQNKESWESSTQENGETRTHSQIHMYKNTHHQDKTINEIYSLIYQKVPLKVPMPPLTHKVN